MTRCRNLRFRLRLTRRNSVVSRERKFRLSQEAERTNITVRFSITSATIFSTRTTFSIMRTDFKRQPLRQNDFGATFGGPLPFLNFGEGVPVFNSGKDRTFFFFSYEGLRLRSAGQNRQRFGSSDARGAK